VEGTALLFLKEVWKHHGIPWVVISDRGPQFVARFTHELYKLLGIKLAMLIAYHLSGELLLTYLLTFYPLSIFFLSPLLLSVLVVLVLTVTIMVTVT
jgi:hypothetical protein